MANSLNQVKGKVESISNGNMVIRGERNEESTTNSRICPVGCSASMGLS